MLAHAGSATATVTTTASTRPVLIVAGDDAPDLIRIECVGDLVKVNGADPAQGPVTCSALIELRVAAGGGDDLVDLSKIDFGIVALHEDVPPSISISGDDGDDRLLAGAGVEQASGGTGADTLSGRGFVSDLTGGPGPDRLVGGGGLDFLTGGDGSDVMLGRGGPDFMLAGRGADRLRGAAGADLMSGSAGRDRLAAGQGEDTLSGDSGRDLLRGGAGDDKLFGGPGADRLLGGPGNDRENQQGSFGSALFGAPTLLSAAPAGPWSAPPA